MQRPMKPAMALVLALMLAAPARAQRVTAYTSADTVTVGQRFLLSLVVERPPEAQPLFPDEVADTPVDEATGHRILGDLEILARKARRGDVAGTAAGLVRDSVIYEVTTFALDTARVPAIPVRFHAPEADTFTVASAPFFVPVASLVPADAADIRDLAPLATFPRLVWHWVLLGMVVGLMALLLWVARRRKDGSPPAPPPAPPRSPFEEAHHRFRELEGVDLARPEAVKPYYVALSEALRIYLGRRLAVPAMEVTTRELVAHLERRVQEDRLASGVPGAVWGILELADFAKFADGHPAPAQGRAALEEARVTVHQVERDRIRVEQAAAAVQEDDEVPTAETVSPSRGRRRWVVPVGAGAVGLVLGLYGGVPAVVLLGLSGLGYLAGHRLFRDASPALTAAFGLTAGLYAWLLGSYVLAPEQVAVPALAMAEMMVAVGALAWMGLRPGRGPAAALALLHGVGLVVTGTLIAAAPGAALLVVFGLWRLGALVALGRYLRRPSLAL